MADHERFIADPQMSDEYRALLDRCYAGVTQPLRLRGGKNMDMDKVMRTDLELPLPERRRRAWERWERSNADIDRLLSRTPKPLLLIGVAMARQEDLLRAVIYLGDPDPRLDIYRAMGIELPEPPQYPKALRAMLDRGARERGTPNK